MWPHLPSFVFFRVASSASPTFLSLLRSLFSAQMQMAVISYNSFATLPVGFDMRPTRSTATVRPPTVDSAKRWVNKAEVLPGDHIVPVGLGGVSTAGCAPPRFSEHLSLSQAEVTVAGQTTSTHVQDTWAATTATVFAEKMSQQYGVSLVLYARQQGNSGVSPTRWGSYAIVHEELPRARSWPIEGTVFC
jgi:hypothetical protein